jgi:hypothetical protein
MTVIFVVVLKLCGGDNGNNEDQNTVTKVVNMATKLLVCITIVVTNTCVLDSNGA